MQAEERALIEMVRIKCVVENRNRELRVKGRDILTKQALTQTLRPDIWNSNRQN